MSVKSQPPKVLFKGTEVFEHIWEVISFGCVSNSSGKSLPLQQQELGKGSVSREDLTLDSAVCSSFVLDHEFGHTAFPFSPLSALALCGKTI